MSKQLTSMGSDKKGPDQKDPAEAAAEWLVRLDGDSVSESDGRAFDRWLAASPEHAEAYRRAQAAWDQFEGLADDRIGQALIQSAMESEPARRFSMPYSLAAGILVAAVIAALLLGNSDEPVDPSSLVASIDAPDVPDYETGVGERLDFSLPDGTKVTLNTSSTLDVAFGDERRIVRLVRGQAYFDVAHNPDRPFTVVAGDRRITALGTAFDVRVDDGETQVLLFDGEIEVAPERAAPGANRPAAAVPAVKVTAGQGVRFAGGEIFRVEQVDPERQLKWRNGLIVLEDETLSAAVSEFNRYTKRPIVIVDSGLGNLRVSGVFRTDKPEHFVDVVGELLPVSVDYASATEIRLIAVAD